MYPCGICGHPCKTVQGLRGHGQLAHPGGDSGGDNPNRREGQISAVNDPGLPANRSHSAELEQRFVQTLDEDSELMDRLTNIDLTVSALLDRQEEAGDDSEAEEEGEAAEAELLRDSASEPSPVPKRGFLASVFGFDSDEELDQAVKEGNPLLFPPGE